eukprot:194193_1
MTTKQCTTTSLKPTWVTICFASLSVIMLIITVIISVRAVEKQPLKKSKKKSTKDTENLERATQLAISDEEEEEALINEHKTIHVTDEETKSWKDNHCLKKCKFYAK